MLFSPAVLIAACSVAANDRVELPEASILEAAGRVTGALSHGDPVQVHAEAAVDGPDGSFRTILYSSSDGRVRMEQHPQGFAAGIGAGGGWLLNSDSSIAELGAAESFVVGHELHMLALQPGSRLGDLRVVQRQPSDPSDILAVAGTLPNGDSLILHFAASDTLPVGLRVPYTEPHVLVRWSDWVERSGLRLFTRAVLVQGAEEFGYSYDVLEVGMLPDSTFEPPVIPQ